MSKDILINPTWEEILDWNQKTTWDTLRLVVEPELVIFASGYGYTHVDIVREIKGDSKRLRLDVICAIAYYNFGRVRFCIDDDRECSDVAKRLLCEHNPNFNQIMKDVIAIRESV